MASVTAAACGCVISAVAAGHCGRSSSPFSASSSFSFASLIPAVPFKNVARVSKLPRRLNTDRAPVNPRFIVSASAREDENVDDAGVIKDMELYLDDLSLEYDSVWDTKPAWCQPWTIVGTGVGAITASWLPFHNAILTGGVTLVIGFWWFSFLYIYPMGYSEMIAERRKMVESGSEDTYGRKRE